MVVLIVFSENPAPLVVCGHRIISALPTESGDLSRAQSRFYDLPSLQTDQEFRCNHLFDTLELSLLHQRGVFMRTPIEFTRSVSSEEPEIRYCCCYLMVLSACGTMRYTFVDRCPSLLPAALYFARLPAPLGL